MHPILNGNKARKLQALLDNQILDNKDTIISYGGNQSNMLYSLSYLCFIKKKKFIYYTTKIPSHIKNNPTGNLKEAINFKANIMEIEKKDFDESIIKIKNKLKENEFFINQGGKEIFSKYGIQKLAQEIQSFIINNNINNIDIFIPSGTGTSSFYLSNFLPNHTVFTTNCIGSTEYLQQQFIELNKLNEMQYKKYPTIIKTKKKYHFGKCYQEFYNLYKEIKKSNIHFELLYDMKSFISIKENISNINKQILYIHCGGAHANQSMEDRYKYNQIPK